MNMIIEERVSLKPYTTFMTEATARYFCEIHTNEDLYGLFQTSLWKEVPHLIMGMGSNMLIAENLDALVVHMNTQGREILEENQELIVVKVAAGELWHPFVMDMVEEGYWGIENLALIPGTVGAAPVQNIGAYGVEAKDTIVSVEVIDLDTYKKEILTNVDCRFSYRNSIFKEYPKKYLVTSVTFRLNKEPRPQLTYGAIKQVLEESSNEHPTSKDIADIVMKIRRSKLPEVGEIGTAGSFFKNPIIPQEHAEKLKDNYPDIVTYPVDDDFVKISAGWLIEQLGYKGVREGDVGTYTKHALVLVNHGSAPGYRVWEFAEKIINHVYQTFTITLEPEVLVIKNPV